jgi:hypothetical protein
VGLVTNDCEHPLCELIGGPCSLATRRSRGCRSSPAPQAVAPEVYDVVRILLAAIASGDAERRQAAVRLAEIVRRETCDGRNLVTQARDDDPELAFELGLLCRRRGAISA